MPTGGSLVARAPVPLADHVMRFVPKNKQQRDPDTDAYQGLSAAAFALRAEDAGGLSVTWVEYFGGQSPANLRAGAAAYRESLDSKKLGPTGLFAIAEVRDISSKAANYRKSVRVVHSPVPGNDGHAEVRHFTDDDMQLLDSLARDVFTQVVFVRDLGLPKRAA